MPKSDDPYSDAMTEIKNTLETALNAENNQSMSQHEFESLMWFVKLFDTIQPEQPINLLGQS